MIHATPKFGTQTPNPSYDRGKTKTTPREPPQYRVADGAPRSESDVPSASAPKDSWSDGHPVANHGETRAPRGANAAGPMHLEVTRTDNSTTESSEKIRMGELQLRDFSFNDGHIFHSTSSKAWPGLQKARGLVPGKSLKEHGINRVTGEGDINAQGEKAFIHFGRGSEGLGKALAYFKLNKESTNFSPHLYSNNALKEHLRKARSVVSLWTLPPEHQFGESGYAFNLTQAQNRLRQLETEQALREAMPRRPKNTRPYPMMFDVKNVDVDYDTHLKGEVMVGRQVMFSDKLARVFVPVENLEHAKNQLGQILGDNHSVAVIPMESLRETLMKPRQDAEDSSLDDDTANTAATVLRTEEELYEDLAFMEYHTLSQYDRAIKDLEDRKKKLSV